MASRRYPGTIPVLPAMFLRSARNAGFQIVAGTPEELGARLAAEVPMVKDLVERTGIKPE